MTATNENPYPKNFEEFLQWFQTEEDCRDYLEFVRWNGTFSCAKCGHDSYWITKDGLRRCKACQFKNSVRSGTIFEGGHKSLRLWFYVMWLLMAQKTGMSALNFHDAFGFGSYQTSWAWLQKLRSIMIRPGRDQLSGRVEVDETYIGGQKRGKRCRGAEFKMLVLVGVEGASGARLGRVRFRLIDSPTAAEIKKFVSDFVSPGSEIVTDGLKSYSFLDDLWDYTHKTVVMSKPSSNPDESHLEHVHLVISLVKRWLLGTHQGAVTPNHISGYLDEFAFRFNRRLSTHRGKLFHRLVEQAVTTRSKKIKEFYA